MIADHLPVDIRRFRRWCSRRAPPDPIIFCHYLVDLLCRHARSPITTAAKSIWTASSFKLSLECLFYIDVGANLNAQIGLTNPATCGGDVCHMNLHKTFAMWVKIPLILTLC